MKHKNVRLSALFSRLMKVLNIFFSLLIFSCTYAQIVNPSNFTFLVTKREDLSLLARQHPSYFILFTEQEPQIVLNEIDSLVKQSLAQLQPCYTCILCHNTFTDQLEAISHSYTHPRMQTRQKQRVCISNVIRDTSFCLYSCPRCLATFLDKTNLHAHMHLHVDKNLQVPIVPI